MSKIFSPATISRSFSDAIKEMALRPSQASNARRGAHGAGERRPLPILGFDDGLALALQAAPPCPALTAPAHASLAASRVLHQPRTSFSSYAGRDFVEVLTECRVQYLSRGHVRFVDARRY
jgi:hypothetical protein